MALDKVDLKNVFWILFALDEVFKFWREVCESWTAGVLPEKANITGNECEDKFINVALFRPVEGNLNQEEIKFVLTEVRQGSALILKNSANRSLESLAMDLKIIKKVEHFIVQLDLPYCTLQNRIPGLLAARPYSPLFGLTIMHIFYTFCSRLAKNYSSK